MTSMRESMYRGNDLTERGGYRGNDLTEIEYRHRTKENPALRLVGHQGRIGLEQMWFPSRSPDMTL